MSAEVHFFANFCWIHTLKWILIWKKRIKHEDDDSNSLLQLEEQNNEGDDSSTESSESSESSQSSMDTEYKISSHLKKFRGLLNAGGSSGKKLLAIEYGITSASIDFTDTRWASLVRAIIYLAKKQSMRDLRNAKERLEELAEKGDVTAREALEDIVEPNIMFNVCYQFVESIAEAIYRLL